MKDKIKITVVGSGYVGMSLAVLLAQHNEVVVLDVDISRVEQINNKKSTIADAEIEAFLDHEKLSIVATQDAESAYKDANFVIVATPTNYNSSTNKFDTSTVDTVVEDALSFNSNCLVIIKSTIPVGHTSSLKMHFDTNRIIFSPEFLREGKALYDNLYPSRIIVGGQCYSAKQFANLLSNGAVKKEIEILFVSSSEAESIKLFANTYLAMRVSFFNELDTYALVNGLDTKNIIEGVCLDERIGGGYNNPSFGYGGYCLPKDTKQLLTNYDQVPQTLIKAIVSSNTTRKDVIADEIINRNPKVVGFFRLVMKEGSDNFRSSATRGIMERIKRKGIKIIVYEPKLDQELFLGSKVFTDLNKFKEVSDVIVANRKSDSLNDVYEKCFSRDLFGEN